MSDSSTRKRPGEESTTASLPYEIKVTCDFSKTNPVVTVDPEEAKPAANQKIRFICADATLVIVTQHHSRGIKESDHSPFANDVPILTVPKRSPKPFHVTVKGDEAIDPGPPDPEIRHPGYKYTIVAVSDDGKIAVVDPTIIIR